MKATVANKTIGKDEVTGEYVDVPVGEYDLIEDTVEKSVVVLVGSRHVRITRRVTL